LLEIARPGMIYTIETNGTSVCEFEKLHEYVAHGMTTFKPHQLFLSISPKLASSNVLGNEMHAYNNHWQFIPLLEKLPDYQIKFVVSEALDGSKVMGAMDVIGVGDHPERVYLMPQGIDPEVITKNAQYCVQIALHQGYTVTDRMHIRFFGNRREV
jgi:organic radical activating enzyme